VAGCCECGVEPSGSCATELVHKVYTNNMVYLSAVFCSYGGEYEDESLLGYSAV
jgi:hypothetical protein